MNSTFSAFVKYVKEKLTSNLKNDGEKIEKEKGKKLLQILRLRDWYDIYVLTSYEFLPLISFNFANPWLATDIQFSTTFSLPTECNVRLKYFVSKWTPNISLFSKFAKSYKKTKKLECRTLPKSKQKGHVISKV